MWGVCVPIFRDPHPTSARCRGIKCTADVTCDICKDWSVVQWEAFLKRRPYSGRRKKRPSGFALPPASQIPAPFASASSEAGRPAPPPQSLLPPPEGRDCSGRGGGGGGLARSPLPLPFFWREERGEAPRGPWLLRAHAIQLLPPFRARG